MDENQRSVAAGQDPMGLKRQDYRLRSILNLTVACFLCGRLNLRAVFRTGVKRGFRGGGDGLLRHRP